MKNKPEQFTTATGLNWISADVDFTLQMCTTYVILMSFHTLHKGLMMLCSSSLIRPPVFVPSQSQFAAPQVWRR